MFNWLLKIYENPVTSDVIAPDNTIDGYGNFPTNQNNVFLTGILVGFFIAIMLWGFSKLCKYIFLKAFKGSDHEKGE